MENPLKKLNKKAGLKMLCFVSFVLVRIEAALASVCAKLVFINLDSQASFGKMARF